MKAGWEVRKIARHLGRDPGVISREIRRNRNADGTYRAVGADVLGDREDRRDVVAGVRVFRSEERVVIVEFAHRDPVRPRGPLRARHGLVRLAEERPAVAAAGDRVVERLRARRDDGGVVDPGSQQQVGHNARGRVDVLDEPSGLAGLRAQGGTDWPPVGSQPVSDFA